jgi:hypothetical protein
MRVVRLSGGFALPETSPVSLVTDHVRGPSEPVPEEVSPFGAGRGRRYVNERLVRRRLFV